MKNEYSNNNGKREKQRPREKQDHRQIKGKRKNNDAIKIKEKVGHLSLIIINGTVCDVNRKGKKKMCIYVYWTYVCVIM
jgi:hypothetical protein